MAKADTSRIEALDAVLAEKRKHEGFLAKLDERRASTPANVFTRLRDEYLTKITDLQVRASIEAESLSEGLKEDEAAVVEIEARLAAIIEERLEGELRAEVGEYDPKEWGERLKSLNANLAKIEKDRDGRVATFERTRALLTEARGPMASAEPEVVVPAPAPVPAPVAPSVSAPIARPTPQPVAPQPVLRTSGVEAMPAVPVAAVAASPAPAVVATTPAAPVPVVPAAVAPAAVAPAAVAPAPVAPAPVAPAAPPAVVAPAEPQTPAAPRPPAPMAGSPSFDELAFLNSVVGRASVPLKAEPPASRPSRPISELRDTGANRTPAIPAAPIAPPPRAPSVQPTEEADSGPLGRPTPRTSQAIKTLKCAECGTLNYPTEWYCERCGGELAAL